LAKRTLVVFASDLSGPGLKAVIFWAFFRGLNRLRKNSGFRVKRTGKARPRLKPVSLLLGLCGG